MNTPPPKLGKRERETPASQMATPILLPPSQQPTPILLPPSQQPTPILLPLSQQPTPIVPIPKKQRTIHGTNLRNAFEDEQHSDYLRQRLEEIMNRNSNNHTSDYENRLEETAKMVFRLPKKNGGKQSTKRAKKHRKKTLKKRARK